MKHFKMPPPLFIAWIRMCRQGSVIGPQQQYLCMKYPEMLNQGTNIIEFDSLTAKQKEYVFEQSKMKMGEDRLKLSDKDKQIMNLGDLGQANNLLAEKKN